MHNDTREPDYTRFTLVDTFARDKSRESREVARTSCYRSPPFDTPPLGGEKSHHSFAPFTFPAAFAFYRIQEWLCKYFKSSKPECAQKLTNSFETSLRGYVFFFFFFGQRERERGEEFVYQRRKFVYRNICKIEREQVRIKGEYNAFCGSNYRISNETLRNEKIFVIIHFTKRYFQLHCTINTKWEITDFYPLDILSNLLVISRSVET